MSASISRVGSAAAVHAHHGAGKTTAAGSFENLFAALAGAAESPVAAPPSAAEGSADAGEEAPARHEETPSESALPASMPAVAILIGTPAMGTLSGDAEMAGAVGRDYGTTNAHLEKSAATQLSGTSPSSVLGTRGEIALAAARSSMPSVESETAERNKALDASAARRTAPKLPDAAFAPNAAASRSNAATGAASLPATLAVTRSAENLARVDADVARQDLSRRTGQSVPGLRATVSRMAHRDATSAAGDVGSVDVDASLSRPPSTLSAASLSTVLALGRADSLVAKPVSAGADPSTQPMAALIVSERRVDASPLAATQPGTPAFDPAAWTAALARHVQLLAQGEHAETRIDLEPHGLGPMQVSVRMQDAQVHVHFSILHPVTQALVRDALPTLERLLGEGGMSLGQASVSQQQAGGGERQSGGAPKLRESVANVESRTDPVTVAEPQRLRVGLLDDFI